MYLISACLIGENCKYNGGNNLNIKAKELYDKGLVIPICPEQMGGLSTPRIPSEIVGDKVIMRDGKDVSFEFELGAQKALKIALDNNCKYAILQARSPSCGSEYIYDGSFSNTLIKAQGKTAKLFHENGIKVLTIDQFLEGTYED